MVRESDAFWAVLTYPAHHQLSYPLTALNDAGEVRDAILHEIAHALAPRKAGHGAQWKGYAKAIGCRPHRCAPATVRFPPQPWICTCPVWGQSGERYRRVRISYGRCESAFDDRFLMVWTHRPTA